MTAILELGAVFGAAQSGLVADRYSRKKAIMIGCLWFLLGGSIQAGKAAFFVLLHRMLLTRSYR
jgi:MFS family permease